MLQWVRAQHLCIYSPRRARFAEAFPTIRRLAPNSAAETLLPKTSHNQYRQSGRSASAHRIAAPSRSAKRTENRRRSDEVVHHNTRQRPSHTFVCPEDLYARPLADFTTDLQKAHYKGGVLNGHFDSLFEIRATKCIFLLRVEEYKPQGLVSSFDSNRPVGLVRPNPSSFIEREAPPSRNELFLLPNIGILANLRSILRRDKLSLHLCNARPPNSSNDPISDRVSSAGLFSRVFVFLHYRSTQ
jgi:hypothetical protein